jgi:hypothetical protein
MKTFFKNTLISLVTSVLFFSCEKGELLNSEADILGIVLPKNMKVGEAIITNNKVRIPRLTVYREENEIFDREMKSLAPQFVLTSGATISDDGIPRDFSQPRMYTVTSQDGKWKKEYEISFFSKLDTKTFDFTHFTIFETSTKKKYHEFYEIDKITGNTQLIWASGNSGFVLTAKVADPPEAYPTFSIPDGKIGSGVKLVTRSTGVLGSLVGMPIAAGNLFIGNFNVNDALSKPLEATQFGIQTTQGKPLALHLWCKYKPGLEYKDSRGSGLPLTDRPDVYAVVYEPLIDAYGHPEKLNGTNIKTAVNIVSIALLSDELAEQMKVSDIDKDAYRYIEIPFESRQPFEPKKSAAGNYFMTLVFTSSVKGNLFEGAVESAFCVDEVEIICEEN